MWWLFKGLIGLASSGALRSIMNAIGLRSGDAKAEVQMVAIQAEVDARYAARDVLLAEQGWWVTRLIRPLFAYPLILYYAVIVFDSIPLFGHTVGSWQIAKLPEPMMQWSGWIICAYFLTRPFENVARGALQVASSWLARRFQHLLGSK